ncbi:MAG: metallophosphoesterase [Bacteroidales bacterium]
MLHQICLVSFLMLATGYPETENTVPGPQVSLVVFSDPHYYDPCLGTGGTAFESLLEGNVKMIAESRQILEEAVQKIIRWDPDLVLIPGDLTKDGSLISHLRFAGYLASLEEQGAEVFVIPGNHDILNRNSLAYVRDTFIRVQNVDPVRFEQIYAHYGYGEAIFRDPVSLSYVAEPAEGLWIIGLDPCIYHPGPGQSRGDGELRPGTILWLKEILEMPEAREKQKFAMMHHGVLEHFRGQNRYFNEYVVNDHRKVSRMLAENGIRVVFTGHYHANDITLKEWSDGSVLYDVETGSLVTFPCPIRKIKLAGDSMKIETAIIRSIPSKKNDFSEYAKDYAVKGVSCNVEAFLLRWHFRPEDADQVAFQIGQAFADHCAGDEIPRDPPIDTNGLSLKAKFFVSFRKRMVRNLRNDLAPPDNNLTIDLRTGRY